MRLTSVVGTVILLLLTGFVPESCAAEAVRLRCEYRENPIAIDTAIPRLSWAMRSDEPNQFQTAYHILVATSADQLAEGRGDLWDSGRVESNETIHIEYAGRPLHCGQRCWWKIRLWDAQGRPSPWSEPAFWQVALLEPEDWSAQWIAETEEPGDTDQAAGSTLLRKEFQIDGPVKRATASVYGLGWFELYLNGKKVGDHVLAPPASRYSRRLLFDTFDVTEQLIEGDNAVGIWLGNGYDAEYSKWGWRYNGPRRAILQIDVETANGERTRIVSDRTWKCAPGSITACGIYSGETYDARLEQPGWCEAGFDAANWTGVRTVDGPGGRLAANTMPPIRVIETIRPVQVMEPKPGVFVFDMGRNFAGWVRVRAKGPGGSRIVLRHSELVGEDGMIDPWTNRNAKATDVFVLEGRGIETYEPRFTYHGFRYVELTGYPGRPTLDDVEGRVIHADVGKAGQWSCSDPLLNRIQANFLGSIRSNLMGIPTDCPQRDERTPCAMDSRVYEEAAINNFDMDAYYAKWLRDIRPVPMLDDWPGDGKDPDWASDKILLPWRLWQYYGDRRALEECYESMSAYVDWVHEQAPNHLYSERFGDWCAPNPGDSWKDFFHDVTLVNTALYFRSTEIVRDAAGLLGKGDDARRYDELTRQIRDAVNRELLGDDGVSYGDGSQTTSVLPLAFGIAADGNRARVFDYLVNRIETTDRGHLDTGITGTRYLFDVLLDHGRPDVAMTILSKRTYPSYGYQIDQGATTTWEQWSFRGPMNSHNHAMFAGPGSTFYTRLAGIRPAEPGYRRIEIAPSFPESLQHVQAWIDTVRGLVESRWERESDGSLRLKVRIPANTRAQVVLPEGRFTDIFEGGDRIELDRKTEIRMGADAKTLQLPSGTYTLNIAIGPESAN